MIEVVILTPGQQMQGEYVTSLVNTINVLNSQNISFSFGNGQSALVARARQTPYQVARDMDFQRLVWIDSDISWQSESFFKLLSNNLDIVTGAYLDELGQVVAMGLNQQRITKEQLNSTTPIEIVWCGFGFISLSRDVVTALPEPFIKSGEYGEDIAFCMNARNMGFKIYLDPTIKVTHHKTVAITP
jgi:hypothetical protein